MTRTIKAGEGWRVGWNPEANPYQGMVAGDGWAIELTTAEFQDLAKFSVDLEQAIAAIAAELMDEERITCEAESHHIWVEATGFPGNYSLRFLLLTGRGAEGEWPPAIVPAVQLALRSVQIF